MNPHLMLALALGATATMMLASAAAAAPAANVDADADASHAFTRGMAYYTGDGQQQNYAKARHWFEQAAQASAQASKQGNKGGIAAQRTLGDIYRKGQGVAKNPYVACGWYQRAARQGDAQAHDALGVLYALHSGTATDPAHALAMVDLGESSDPGGAARMRAAMMNIATPEDVAEAKALAKKVRASETGAQFCQQFKPADLAGSE